MTTMNGPPHAGPHPWRNARFDPRRVVFGFVLLIIASLLGYMWGDQAARKADEVAAPVAQLCERGGSTGAALATSGACGAAGQVAEGTGPFRSEVVGLRGVAGAPGTIGITGQSGVNGAPGIAGTPGGIGTNGARGVDGVSPTCLAETTVCRGADGTPGANGLNGTDGANGLNGTDGANGADGVPGPAGPPGANGADGRGITRAEVVDCRLIITYSDTSTQDVGQVCTPAPAPPEEGP